MDIVLEDDSADLKRKIDWVLKLWLLDRSRCKGVDERRLRYLDMKYHDLDPRTGIYERCHALGMVDALVTDAQILQGRYSAPRDTRARLRGKIIQRVFAKNVDVKVENWKTIHVTGRPHTSVGHHPFHGLKNRINHLEINLADPFFVDDPSMMAALDQFILSKG